MADDNGEAIAGTVLKDVSPLLSAIPVAGVGISALAGITGGILESDAAKKQQQEAQNARNQANSMTAAPLEEGFKQKAQADTLASLSDMPGWSQAHQLLMEQQANYYQAVRDSSPNGASGLNAISRSLGLHNDALLNLAAQNEQYKAATQKDARDDLWNLGLQSHERNQELYQKQLPIYQQANNLEAASTSNKNSALQLAIGALSSGATNLSKMAGSGTNSTTSSDVMSLLKQFLKGSSGSNASFFPQTAASAATQGNIGSVNTPVSGADGTNTGIGAATNPGVGRRFDSGIGLDNTAAPADLSSLSLIGGF